MYNSLLKNFDLPPEKSKFASFNSGQFYTISMQLVCHGNGVASNLFKTLKAKNKTAIRF